MLPKSASEHPVSINNGMGLTLFSHMVEHLMFFVVRSLATFRMVLNTTFLTQKRFCALYLIYSFVQFAYFVRYI